jgi:hypothetical protein
MKPGQVLGIIALVLAVLTVAIGTPLWIAVLCLAIAVILR